MRTGAIILCGGKSSRMGRDKATLPFGPELMLQRVVRLVGEVVAIEEMVVVAAPNQALPDLPRGISVARDTRSYRGPLEGMATGFRTLAAGIDAVYVTGCDVPLLVPAFVERIFQLLGDFDAAVPFDGEHYHPLVAVYRPAVVAPMEMLINAGELQSRRLFDKVRTRAIPVDDLRGIDPQLSTLKNVNCREDYLVALRSAGFTVPPDV